MSSVKWCNHVIQYFLHVLIPRKKKYGQKKQKENTPKIVPARNLRGEKNWMTIIHHLTLGCYDLRLYRLHRPQTPELKCQRIGIPWRPWP